MINYPYISILAFVFTNILIQPGEIFSFVKYGLAKWNGQKELDLDKLKGIRYGIAKVLICQDCHAGELALWFSVYQYFTSGNKNVLWYIAMIALSIAGAHFLSMVNNALKTETCKT